MNIFRRIKEKFKYPKKEHDPTNTLDHIYMHIVTKPELAIQLEVLRCHDIKVDVYTVDLNNIAPGMIYTNLDLRANYSFTYTPTKSKYHKLMGLNVHPKP